MVSLDGHLLYPTTPLLLFWVPPYFLLACSPTIPLVLRLVSAIFSCYELQLSHPLLLCSSAETNDYVTGMRCKKATESHG